jgi:ribonuclease PH
VALAMALDKLQKQGHVSGRVLTDTVSAISVGIHQGQVFTDLDYNEDSSCEVDMNFVVTGKDGFVEVQGTAERQAFTKAQLDQMTEAGLAATRRIRETQLAALGKLGINL